MGNQTKRKWNHHNSRLLELCQLPQVQETELQQELPNERHNPLSDLPPPCGFGRFIGVNPAGQPQRYQSKLDERWDHFEHWIYNKWTGGIERLPSWAQTGYNKTYWGMYKWGKSPAISLVWK